ncbi:hypothetical protein J7E93_08090 [Streptomyces sp. ISL-36]|uniref:hypothetical protein n=1 Tax=Streptomyces sp. ISL-36 TaxID=2819182 RepID=UPI001BECCFF1|nr:hypothetical protein [Streptomyces sp. ISL-36]MBT2440079.1 hypothetical protein [Streptomyces sp. ISL-36]
MTGELAGDVRPQRHGPADGAQPVVFVVAAEDEDLRSSEGAGDAADDRFGGVAAPDLEPSLHYPAATLLSSGAARSPSDHRSPRVVQDGLGVGMPALSRKHDRVWSLQAVRRWLIACDLAVDGSLGQKGIYCPTRRK